MGLGRECIGFLANLASTEESGVITGGSHTYCDLQKQFWAPSGSHIIWNSITLELFRDGHRDFWADVQILGPLGTLRLDSVALSPFESRKESLRVWELQMEGECLQLRNH